MSRGRQKVSFEGLMQENVLGTFKIIRRLAQSAGRGTGILPVANHGQDGRATRAAR